MSAQAFGSGVPFHSKTVAARFSRHGRPGAQGERPRFSAVDIRAASVGSSRVDFEKGDDERARWAGDDHLARVVSSVIAIKPLYKVIKLGAKALMVRSAQKSGIPWKQMVEDLRESKVYAEKELVENTGISYPDYYMKEFHGYKDGNLSWEAAFDVEPATMVTWKRALPDIDSAQKAGEELRRRWLDELDSHHSKFSRGLSVNTILDIGCATGNSTRVLRNYFPSANVTGLDLSPYFLAVAQYIEKEEKKSSTIRTIHYVHANAECTGLPSQSFDVISYAFVFHELPRPVAANMLREGYRLLRPGGTICVTDHSPKSKVIQKLPPALFLMMKSVEPWLDEFHMLNLEEELERIGFTNIMSVLTDPRHFTLTATAP